VDDPQAARPNGLILAGGQGRRMGGRNKGWIPWRGKPLILHALERLQPQVQTLAISAQSSMDHYRRLGFPLLADRYPDFRGPLAGVAEGLLWSQGRNLLCVPVDAPQAPLDLAVRLGRELGDSHAEVALAHDGQRLQPLFALLRTSLADDLLRDMANGPQAAGAWFSSRRHVIVDFSDQPGAFINLNRPEDLERTLSDS
jgi:molybdenum cofactor guanylyltransferase